MTHARLRATVVAALGVTATLVCAACGNASPPAAAGTAKSAPTSSAASPSSATGTPAATNAASATTGAATACSLVTEHEAATALGKDPGPGQGAESHGGAYCTFGVSPTFLSVNVLPAGGRAAYEHARGSVPTGKVTDMAGIGAGAFGVFTGPAAEIWFYKGDTMVTIGLITAGAATAPKDHATVLATAAAGRI